MYINEWLVVQLGVKVGHCKPVYAARVYAAYASARVKSLMSEEADGLLVFWEPAFRCPRAQRS